MNMEVFEIYWIHNPVEAPEYKVLAADKAGVESVQFWKSKMEEKNMSKVLVASFSASGVTESVAKKLAKVLGADFYPINPKVPYTKDDLNWMNKSSRSTVEMEDKSSRPALADKNAKIDAYDTIFVGFPIWWYVAPTIINTFLESYDFSGKKIVLFATSGGSGFGKTLENLKGSVTAEATLVEGKVLNARQTEDDLKSWVETI